jgi:choline dehydrogenase-like flavoprotein
MAPLPDAWSARWRRASWRSARALGLPWRKLDKMIRPQACRSGCWRCVYGCPYGAKWTARDFVDEALRHGLRLVDDARVTRVLVEDGRAAGVEARRRRIAQLARRPLVVLAAGGIGSPRLLRASGLMEGRRPSSAIRWWR